MKNARFILDLAKQSNAQHLAQRQDKRSLRALGVTFCVISMLLLNGCSEELPSWKELRNPNYERAEISVPESQLSLPIRLPLEQLQVALSKKLPIRLMKNKSITGGLTVTMVRNGEIELEGRGENLLWSVPLKIHIGHPIASGPLSTFDVKPAFSSQLEISEDYHLKGKTELVDITWISRAEVKVFGSKIDLTESLDELIREQETVITSGIDKELSQVNIQTVLERTWRKLNNPIRVNRKVQPVYLLVEPTKLQLRDLSFREKVLALDLGVYGNLQTVYDSASNAREEAPYPPLQINDGNVPVNELYLPLVISYERINELLQERLFGLDFQVEGQSLVLDSVEVSSVDSLMLIVATVSGDVEMTVEMMGRPNYMAGSNMLTVKGFDFQVRETSTSLLDWGDYFFHEEVVSELMTKMNLPIGSYVDTIPSLIYRGIERGRSGDNINLSTRIDSIALDQLHIGYDDIALVIFAKGSVVLEVEKIGQKKE